MSSLLSILTDANDAFKNYLFLIDNAKKYISISTWILTKNPVSDIIIEHLKKKIAENVFVTIVHYDNIVVDLITEPFVNNIISLSDGVHLDLKGTGINDYCFPPDRFNLFVTHQKLLCIDDEIVVLSDRNISDEYYCCDKQINNLGFIGIDVTLRDPRLCSYINKHITSKLNSFYYYVSPNISFFVKHPINNIDYITPTYIDTIKKSKKNITIVNVAFNPESTIISELVKAANNGVNVTIVTNKIDHVNSKVSVSETINLAIQHALFINNVTLFGFSDPKLTLHHKYMITDDELIFGSYNFDYYSEKKDVEYICKTNATEILENFKSYTNDLIRTKCENVKLETSCMYYVYTKCICSCCL
jgi:phosphatidylserine/phosphatidylglycerophosphate/cardiolipin synthase-like enzyme